MTVAEAIKNFWYRTQYSASERQAFQLSGSAVQAQSQQRRRIQRQYSTFFTQHPAFLAQLNASNGVGFSTTPKNPSPSKSIGWNQPNSNHLLS